MDYCDTTQACIQDFLKQNELWRACPAIAGPDCPVSLTASGPEYEAWRANFSGPEPIKPLACPNYDDGFGVIDPLSIEIGGLYTYLECRMHPDDPILSTLSIQRKAEIEHEKRINCSRQLPSLTLKPFNNLTAAISLVKRDTSFADLFPPKCSTYLRDIQLKGWFAILVIWYVYYAVGLGWFWYRSNLPPITARNKFLVTWQTVAFAVVIWFEMEPFIFSAYATCQGATVWGTTLGVPLMATPIVARSLRLYFLYSWNKNKLNPMKADWFFAHKYLLKVKWSVFLMLTVASIAFIYAMIIYALTPLSYRGLALESGRCKWWSFDQPVADYADARGIPLGPNAINPNGYAPYSVSYKTCLFCDTPGAIRLMYVVWGNAWLFLLFLSCLLLRNLADQYALWRELIGIMIATFASMNTLLPAAFPSVYNNMWMQYPSIHTIPFIAMFVAWVTVSATLYYPTLLTFRMENQKASTQHSQQSKESDGTDSQGESRGGTTVKKEKQTKIQGTRIVLKKGKTGKWESDATVDTIILDEFGLQQFRLFCVEAFIVENVQYLVEILKYQETQGLQRGMYAGKIYDSYIKEGAQLEVNISYSMRHRYKDLFENNSDKKQDGQATNVAPPPGSVRMTFRKTMVWIGQTLLRRPSAMGPQMPTAAPGASDSPKASLGVPGMTLSSSGRRSNAKLSGAEQEPTGTSQSSPRNTKPSNLEVPDISPKSASKPQESFLRTSPKQPSVDAIPEENGSEKPSPELGPIKSNEPEVEMITIAVLNPDGSIRASHRLTEAFDLKDQVFEDSKHGETKSNSPKKSASSPSSPASPSLLTPESFPERENKDKEIAFAVAHTSSTDPEADERDDEPETAEAQASGGEDDLDDDKDFIAQKSRQPSVDIDLVDKEKLLNLAKITFKDVTREVRNLLRNDWRRFQQSTYYATFLNDLVSRHKLEKIGLGDHMRSDRDRVNTKLDLGGNDE